jgi:hypothetical protein
MAKQGSDRQAAYMERVRNGIAPVVRVIAPPAPTTRKARLASIAGDLKTLAGEYQTWLDSRAPDYADKSDANAERLAEVESFLEHVAEVLDALDTIEVPRIRID